MAISSEEPTLQENDYSPSKKGIHRRELFLDAATRAFASKGFEGTSLQDIVAEAGGSLATLYRLFGNKEGLFQAVISRRFETVFEQTNALKMKGKSPEKALREVGMGLMDMILSEEAVAMHRLMIAEGGRTPRLRQIFMELAPDRGKTAIAEYLAEETRNGRLNVKDCELAAVQFLGMIKGDILMRRLLGEDVGLTKDQREKIVRNAVGIFLDGVGSPD